MTETKKDAATMETYQETILKRLRDDMATYLPDDVLAQMVQSVLIKEMFYFDNSDKCHYNPFRITCNFEFLVNKFVWIFCKHNLILVYFSI